MNGEPLSLFDAPRESVLADASNWLASVLDGPLALLLCTIAVAILGLMMLAGRISVRGGLQVVLGCFVLFGAAAIARSLQDMTSLTASSGRPQSETIDVPPPAAPLPPPDYDPYARASMPSQ